MVFVLSFGSYTVITSRGLDLDVGQMSSLLTYSFQILMSLMMLSMVFVMITMATESAERIVEVLNEESTLQSPEHAVTEMKDGSIDFDHVSFKYSQNAERMVLSDIDLHIRSGEIIGYRRNRLFKIKPDTADPPPLRRYGRDCESRRRRREGLRPDGAAESGGCRAAKK